MQDFHSTEELEVTLVDGQNSAKTIWEKLKKTDPRKLLILKSLLPISFLRILESMIPPWERLHISISPIPAKTFELRFDF